MKDDVIARIVACGVIPVVRAPSADLARSAVNAIVMGGIDVVEVTMTVPDAVPLIQSLVGRYGRGVAVGAGTVLDVGTAQACVSAGATFIVSPISDGPTIAWCRSQDVAVLPGALTPTEIAQAARAGGDLIKVFPCGAVGGANYIRSVRVTVPNLRLVPTGGVSLQTAGDFIRAGASAIGVGSDLVDVEKLRDGDVAAISECAARYLDAVRVARESRAG